jgi:hypothetical protein
MGKQMGLMDTNYRYVLGRVDDAVPDDRHNNKAVEVMGFNAHMINRNWKHALARLDALGFSATPARQPKERSLRHG